MTYTCLSSKWEFKKESNYIKEFKEKIITNPFLESAAVSSTTDFALFVTPKENFQIKLSTPTYPGQLVTSSASRGFMAVDPSSDHSLGFVVGNTDKETGWTTISYSGIVKSPKINYEEEELTSLRNKRFVFKKGWVPPELVKDFLRNEVLDKLYFRNPYNLDYLWNLIIKFGHWDFPILLSNQFPIYL